SLGREVFALALQRRLPPPERGRHDLGDLRLGGEHAAQRLVLDDIAARVALCGACRAPRLAGHERHLAEELAAVERRHLALVASDGEPNPDLTVADEVQRGSVLALPDDLLAAGEALGLQDQREELALLRIEPAEELGPGESGLALALFLLLGDRDVGGLVR